ncbi:hypothetical protein CY0110_17687 [Crocosphaera chwakensis CCY0110]|uniref:Uncharacterized protein n=1 Tax=Crocosphaera chwakensis CCY0110 TaxID=391612 RepID=A3IIL9_9CHRO|nr:hypothetical protein CY0110_17687 [Crocosphaera chwakensis CCY0110]
MGRFPFVPFPCLNILKNILPQSQLLCVLGLGMWGQPLALILVNGQVQSNKKKEPKPFVKLVNGIGSYQSQKRNYPKKTKKPSKMLGN